MVYLLTLMTVVTCVVAKAGYSCWQVVGNAACRANVMEMAIVLLRELHREIELLGTDQSAGRVLRYRYRLISIHAAAQQQQKQQQQKP